MRCLLVLLTLLVSFGAGAPSFAASEGEGPVAYCKAKGTVDAVGSDYKGSAVPDWMVAKAYSPDAIATQKKDGMDPAKTIVWRCADGAVMMCVQGNAPQCGKANQDKTPTEAMQAFCAETPNSEVIPLSVIGHENPMVFDWSCHGKEPKLGGAIFKVDAQGYPAELWTKVTP